MGTDKSRKTFMGRLKRLIVSATTKGYDVSEQKVLKFILEEQQCTLRTAEDYLSSLEIEGFIKRSVGLITIGENVRDKLKADEVAEISKSTPEIPDQNQDGSNT